MYGHGRHHSAGISDTEYRAFRYVHGYVQKGDKRAEQFADAVDRADGMPCAVLPFLSYHLQTVSERG